MMSTRKSLNTFVIFEKYYFSARIGNRVEKKKKFDDDDDNDDDVGEEKTWI